MWFLVWQTCVALVVVTVCVEAMGYDRPIATPAQTLQRKRRIVGGYATTVQQMPFMVSVRKYGEFKCGGTVIAQRCILTAAHCVNGDANGRHNYAILAGNTYLYEQRYRRNVAGIYVAPDYSSKTLDSDLAILQLDAALPLSKNTIETIELAAERPHMDELVQIAGWGFVSDQIQRPAFQLRAAYVQVVEQAACGALYKDYRNVTAHMFCAAVPGRVDACFADSGGPAIVNGRLAGVVSWGRGQRCAEPNAPGVYAAVATQRHWIEQIMAAHCV